MQESQKYRDFTKSKMGKWEKNNIEMNEEFTELLQNNLI